MQLSLEQSYAVTSAVDWFHGLEPWDGTHNELSIQACAGSGKTRVAVEIARQTNARVITFTRRAGRMLRERGCEDSSTLHSLAARNADSDFLRRLVTDDVLAELINIWAEKNECATLPLTERKRRFYLHAPKFHGTEDLLRFLPDEMDRLWIVDEAQDMTPLEAQSIRNCSGAVLWIGDPWQQIYGWRGSEGMPRQTADLSLTTNFRSTDAVVAAAGAISGRHEKGTGREAGAIDRTAYLCRSNFGAQAAAREHGATLVAKPDRRKIALLTIQAQAELSLIWARLLRPADSWEQALERWGGILPERMSAARFLMWSATCDLQDFLTDEGDVAMTIHAAKGLEFDRVVVRDWEPKKKDSDDSRLRYVAQTRGREASEWR